MNFGKVRRAQLVKSTLLTSTLVPLGSFKACSDAKEWAAESNGKLPHLFIPSKAATLVPEICSGRPAFEENCNLVPTFVVKDLPFGRTLMMVGRFAFYDTLNILGH